MPQEYNYKAVHNNNNNTAYYTVNGFLLCLYKYYKYTIIIIQNIPYELILPT